MFSETFNRRRSFIFKKELYGHILPLLNQTRAQPLSIKKYFLNTFPACSNIELNEKLINFRCSKLKINSELVTTVVHNITAD